VRVLLDSHVHWDPFDRMLPAQAPTEELLMTSDRRLLRYPVELIPA
jgi:PIN domain nuclease of toxin-antitoxin system